MNGTLEDEKKPFDAETAQDEGDSQPDPDEHLMLDQGNGRVWLVKIPKFLLKRWASIDAEDVHLASIRVYNNSLNPVNKKPRIVLFLPPHRDPNDPTATPPPSQPDRPVFGATNPVPTSATEPDCYELDMVNDSVDNQIVVAERPKDPSLSASKSAAAATTNTRARTTILTGRIKHECSLRPTFSESYRKQMRERHKKYNTPKRQIRMIDDAGVPGGRGGVNRLSSGVGVGAGNAFGDLIKTKPKFPKGTFERMARMPRNQLLDQIFALFRDQPRWGIKTLRERTQQPEVYLKEVLSEVAFLHRSGEYNGLWELKDNFKEAGIKGENVPGPSGFGMDVKMEGVDEEEEDEDEDMEEVS
ncbi:putative transcription initiation factor IIF, beta subunit [Lyophyllum shimeji]|uniref:Transcription initiation factor IIF subunit beta n=1 Tax=Lyophyllum shimeji TaxID=47721 RepID=A0A9P3PWU2_LYOSH|nr:putative transcription initiation factor IIF, beta subunit [Lyophyllum shimeji]